MKIREDDIKRLEDRFGADHVRVEGRQRKGKRLFDDEESGEVRRDGKKAARRTSATASATLRPAPTALTATATPVVTVTKPAVTPEKKKEEPVSTITVVKSFAEAKVVLQAQDNMETCPLCGYRKPKEITVRNRDGAESRVRPIVCKGCSDRYHQYGGEVATKLAKLAPGETIEILGRHAWILSQLDLTRFAQELNEAFQEKERLNAVVQDKIAAHGHLPREVFNPLRDKYGEETGARKAYGTWRRLQARLQAATAVRPEVEKMVADEATKNPTKAAATTPATLAETVTPNETKEEPPATKPTVRKKAAKVKAAK